MRVSAEITVAAAVFRLRTLVYNPIEVNCAFSIVTIFKCSRLEGFSTSSFRIVAQNVSLRATPDALLMSSCKNLQSGGTPCHRNDDDSSWISHLRGILPVMFCISTN
jgi:hypothetical protein